MEQQLSNSPCHHDESILKVQTQMLSRAQPYSRDKHNVVFIFGGPGGRKGLFVDYMVSQELKSLFLMMLRVLLGTYNDVLNLCDSVRTNYR